MGEGGAMLVFPLSSTRMLSVRDTSDTDDLRRLPGNGCPNEEGSRQAFSIPDVAGSNRLSRQGHPSQRVMSFNATCYVRSQ